jgi:ABC-2 type transport system ATP-binding protein/lipopolysaccharide transport system ATP-binding protein
MTYIMTQDLGIKFTVYGNRARSLRHKFFAAKIGGGIVRSDQSNDIVTVEALRNVTVHLRDGDRLGLIGRNGSGKTTLLRAIAGVYEPTSGSIDVQGRIASLTDMSLGMDPEASGYENILLRSICMGATLAQAKSMVKEIEEFTELGEYLSLPLRVYSNGMAVRLAFAISTNIRPDILVMDEMVGAGDVHFAERARSRVHALIDNVGILVIASHSTDIVRQFCNKCLLLHQGRVVEYGEVETVLATYEKLAA